MLLEEKMRYGDPVPILQKWLLKIWILKNRKPASGADHMPLNETQFTVPEDGLYHVIVDTEVGVIAIAKVEWGLIGGATPNGWSDDPHHLLNRHSI